MTPPTQPTTLALAHELRALMATQWTCGAWARNAAGGAVAGDAGDAVCFCLVGGLIHLQALHGSAVFALWNALNRARLFLYPMSIGEIDLNDNVGQDAVLALCDHAIAALEGETAQ